MYESYMNKIEDVGKLRNLKPGTIRTYKNNVRDFSSVKYRNHYAFKELLNTCYEKEWIPHCKKTFNGAQSVINYLGKYTHRIAISNHRIIRMNDDTVTYYVKDYREEGK